MSKGMLNKAALIDSYLEGNSIPVVSEMTGLSRSAVRCHLKMAGVLRTRADAIRLAGRKGRMWGGKMRKGKKLTKEWRENISKAHRERSLKFSKGVSLKPNGYIEITTGKNKFRGQHRVIMEDMIGRPLLRSEHVHHKDGCRSNNDPGNLELMTINEHVRHHAKENNRNRKRDNHGRYI
jgi:hypothetical protein